MNRPNTPNPTAAEIAARALQAIIDRVRTRGWTFLYGPFQGPRAVGYGYTIGFGATYGYPEVVVMSLGVETTSVVLSRLAEMLRAGERPVANQKLDLDLTFPVVLRSVEIDVARGHLALADAFYTVRGAPYEVLQLVWPDAAGRFPWESGFVVAGSYQPKLYADSAPN
jgi:hypothetical protein